MNSVDPNSVLKKVFKENYKVLSPLVGGMMNKSFIVEKDNKRYVLYISTEQANEMVDRPLEKIHQKIAFDLGITSKNVYFDEKNGIKINEFIDGSSIDKVNEFDYKKLAVLFHKLHASKILSKENYNPYLRFKNYEAEAKQFVKDFPQDFLTLKDLFLSNQDFLESQKLVLSHNDAQRSNIIKASNGEYYFIDFEFVGNNDEIYDIACFGNGLVEEGYKLFLEYFENPTIEEKKRYYLWRIYISLQWYLVALVKHYRGEGAAHGFNFLDVAAHFLNNAKTAYSYFQKL